MDSLSINPQNGRLSYESVQADFSNTSADTKVIEATLNFQSKNNDAVEIELEPFYRSLTVTAQKVLAKLNAILQNKITPETKIEDNTPEKTADNIVNGVSLLFDRFQRANSNLQGEELVKEFMKLARSGVESGYSDAYGTLQSIGAFDVGGVEDGVKQTKDFLDKKLGELESKLRVTLGVDKAPEVKAEVKTSTETEVLKQTVDILA